MTLDIRTAESAHSMGTVKFSEWKRDFETRWYLPVGMTMLATMMRSMTPQDLARQRPDAVQNIENIMTRLRGG